MKSCKRLGNGRRALGLRILRTVMPVLFSVSLCAACANHACPEKPDFYKEVDFAPLDNRPFDGAYQAGIEALELSLSDKASYAMTAAKNALAHTPSENFYLCKALREGNPPKSIHFDSEASKLHVEAFNTETSDANLLGYSGTLLCQDGQTKKGMRLLERDASCIGR